MSSIDLFDLAPDNGRHYLSDMIPVLFRRQARIWLQFRVSSVMDILSMMAQASAFFFVGRAIGGTNWSGSYARFLAVGMIVNTCSRSVLPDHATRFREAIGRLGSNHSCSHHVQSPCRSALISCGCMSMRSQAASFSPRSGRPSARASRPRSPRS